MKTATIWAASIGKSPLAIARRMLDHLNIERGLGYMHEEMEPCGSGVVFYNGPRSTPCYSESDFKAQGCSGSWNCEVVIIDSAISGRISARFNFCHCIPIATTGACGFHGLDIKMSTSTPQGTVTTSF